MSRRKNKLHTLSPLDGKGYDSEVWVVEAELIEDWLKTVDEVTFDLIGAAVEILAEHGPGLGRPLVDTVIGSRHSNMKELRPGSSGRSEVRILFAFDPRRKAILLVAGDKHGQWQRWYKDNIPIADDRYDKHLTELKKQDEEAARKAPAPKG
ncbi:MAG TPA: type II toxin-antitoxin system RelE/ParE family toxin, partial [Marmoricola sp.]